MVNKLVTLISLICLLGLDASALVIPQGKFYFDNSLTAYEQVKFVYGHDSRSETYVLSMNRLAGDKWEITIPQRVEDMYRYTFANTTLPDGKIDDNFVNVKEHISKVRNEYRTATTDKQIIVDGIFTPESGDNWAQGSWKFEATGVGYSMTLPVIFINTENHQEIVSKEDYINATYYVETFSLPGYEPIGAEDDQLQMEIRGRGNYTWKDFDKKPYRIKLGEKLPILGMNKSKHFALLAHADDNLGFYRNTVGFELSRLIGLPFTPEQRPVEVVLNGDYIGLYFLTETVRVDEDRVNISEQEDYATDPTAVTGGWLVEIDNYDEVEQVRITEGNGVTMRFTYKSPELLSEPQREYLISQMNAIDDAIYVADKNSTQWEQLVDIDALVRFYIVQEVMQNAESFHGSCYLHKDIGENEKWKFGPVWDFGNSFHNGYNRFIYIDSPFGNHWIHKFAEFPNFQNYVKTIWSDFYANRLPLLDGFMKDFAEQIGKAAQSDYQRWPGYGNADMTDKYREMKEHIDDRVNWLQGKWKDAGVEELSCSEPKLKCSVRSGRLTVASEAQMRDISVYNLAGIECFSAEMPGYEITTSLSEGVYLIAVTLADGRTIRRKIVMQ